MPKALGSPTSAFALEAVAVPRFSEKFVPEISKNVRFPSSRTLAETGERFGREGPIGSAAPKFPNDLSAHHIHAGAPFLRNGCFQPFLDSADRIKMGTGIAGHGREPPFRFPARQLRS